MATSSNKGVTDGLTHGDFALLSMLYIAGSLDGERLFDYAMAVSASAQEAEYTLKQISKAASRMLRDGLIERKEYPGGGVMWSLTKGVAQQLREGLSARAPLVEEEEDDDQEH